MVVLAVAAAAGYVNREKLALKIKSVYVKVPPKAAQPQPQTKRRPQAFTGDAPWALSALPECFVQTSESTAPDLSYVLSRLPKGAVMARPATVLRYGDCTLHVEGEQVLVTRGSDRMRIPPKARIYTAPGELALLRGSGGGYDLRVYNVRP